MVEQAALVYSEVSTLKRTFMKILKDRQLEEYENQVPRARLRGESIC